MQKKAPPPRPVERVLRPREDLRDVGNRTDSVVIATNVYGRKRRPLLSESS